MPRLVELPVQIEPAASEAPPAPFQPQLAFSRVDALSEPRHDVLERAILPDRRGHELEKCLNPGVGGAARGQPVGHHVWKPAVLDPERLAGLAAIQKVDRAGYRRPL